MSVIRTIAFTLLGIVAVLAAPIIFFIFVPLTILYSYGREIATGEEYNFWRDR